MNGQHYVEAVLRDYCQLPDTPNRPRRNDRRLAGDLYRRGVPYELVRAALLTATTRRSTRSPNAPQLNPIQSLAYFLPVVDELTRDDFDPGYLRYLEGFAQPQ